MLVIQLSPNARGRAVEDGPRAWDRAAHMGDPDGSFRSLASAALRQGTAAATEQGKVANQLLKTLSLVLHRSLPLNNFQKKSCLLHLFLKTTTGSKLNNGLTRGKGTCVF